jgi:hypothetical protein
LAWFIFSEPQFPAIAELNQETIIAFRKASPPLVSRATANSHDLDHV